MSTLALLGETLRILHTLGYQYAAKYCTGFRSWKEIFGGPSQWKMDITNGTGIVRFRCG